MPAQSYGSATLHLVAQQLLVTRWKGLVKSQVDHATVFESFDEFDGESKWVWVGCMSCMLWGCRARANSKGTLLAASSASWPVAKASRLETSPNRFVENCVDLGHDLNFGNPMNIFRESDFPRFLWSAFAAVGKCQVNSGVPSWQEDLKTDQT